MVHSADGFVGPALLLSKRMVPLEMIWCDFQLITYEILLMKMGNYLLKKSWSCTFKYEYIARARVDEGVRSRDGW